MNDLIALKTFVNTYEALSASPYLSADALFGIELALRMLENANIMGAHEILRQLSDAAKSTCAAWRVDHGPQLLRTLVKVKELDQGWMWSAYNLMHANFPQVVPTNHLPPTLSAELRLERLKLVEKISAVADTPWSGRNILMRGDCPWTFDTYVVRDVFDTFEQGFEIYLVPVELKSALGSRCSTTVITVEDEAFLEDALSIMNNSDVTPREALELARAL